MKKKIALFVMVLGITINMGAVAQGYPVIDISAIIAAIDNGVTMTQQLQAMYETLKTSREQLQKQIKSFEAFDFNSLDARDPLGSWRSLTTYADRMATYEKNIESIIHKKNINIGNASYSLYDILAPVGTAVRDAAIDQFEKSLSPEEREIFNRKYGIAYGYYMRLTHMGEMLQKKAVEVIAYSNNLKENLAEDRERLSAITENMNGAESIVQQQQVANAVMSVIAQDIKTQASLLGDISSQLAISAAQAQAEKQAKLDEINMNSLGLSDGFLKMLDDMPPESAYR